MVQFLLISSPKDVEGARTTLLISTIRLNCSLLK